MIDNIMWNQKYRPTSLEEIALEEENRSLFQSYLDQGEFPHLLLSGPAGCGKTTVAQILIDGVGAESIELNASQDRGIDVVRNKISTFAKGKMGTSIQVIFLDESDQLTAESLTALRRVMEKYSEQTRFILTCNYVSKIIDPIQSRCQHIEMSEIPVQERFRVLRRILSEEGIEADGETVKSYAESYTDMRRMISAAQRSVLSTGALQPASEMTVTGEDLFEWCKKGRYDKIRNASQQKNFNHQSMLEKFFWAIPDDFEKATSWRVHLHEAINERPMDVVVHFCGTCAGLIKTVE